MTVFAGDIHVLLCKKYNNANVLMTQSWVICCDVYTFTPKTMKA